MKKGLCLILALVMVLSLCACGGNGNESTEPETAKSQKEILTELLVSSTWSRTAYDDEMTFFDDGTGILEGTWDGGNPKSLSFTWDIKGDKLVYTLTNGWSEMHTYIEEEGYFENSAGEKIVPVG